MLERMEFRQYIGRGLAAVGFLFLTGCGQGTAERVFDVNSPSSEEATVFRGDGYDIRRMANDVFLLKGRYPDRGVLYISSKCEVLSVGAWRVDGGSAPYISEHTVTVQDGSCIPELVR